ncbi:MAG: hypothetical protein QM296_08610 [Bacillota bacterium]|nr:hypothetical protein [Bacillota bacterium]
MMKRKYMKAGRKLLLVVLVIGLFCILPGVGVKAELLEINCVGLCGPNLEPGITLRYLRENTYKMMPADAGGAYENITISAQITGETLPDVDMLPDDIFGERCYQLTYTWTAPEGYTFASEMLFMYFDDDGEEHYFNFYTYSQTTESGNIEVIVGTLDVCFLELVLPTESHGEIEIVPTTTAEPTTTAAPTTTAEPTPTTTAAPTPTPTPPPEDLVRQIAFSGPLLAPGQLPSVIMNELDLLEPLEKAQPGGWRVEIHNVDSVREVPKEQPLLAKKYRLCLVWTGLPGVKIAPSQEVDMFYNDLGMAGISVLDPNTDNMMIAVGDTIIDLSGIEAIIGPERFTPGGGIQYMYIH